MKVLFIARSTLYKDPGGDTIQVLRTADHLKRLGVDVTIRLTGEIVDYAEFDLLHFFNIIRPADILRHSIRSGKPFVVSTIYVDYTEYERTVRGGPAGLLFRMLSPDLIEYAKVIARRLVSGEKIISPSYVWLGQKRSIRRIIRGSGMLLPNSHSEYRRLEAHYGVTHPYRAIPNGIELGLFAAEGRERSGVHGSARDAAVPVATAPDAVAPDVPARDPGLVLCVGRIEGRKNQLNLIRALQGTAFRLVIIGSSSVNQPGYYQACREAAGPGVRFIAALPQEELIGYYRQAKVHALPSWFETTGLSTLEAAAMGCNVVITEKGDTREYFQDDGWYCDPASPVSIREAVEKASAADFSESLRTRIFTQYTWEQTAQKTLAAYKEIIDPGAIVHPENHSSGK